MIPSRPKTRLPNERGGFYIGVTCPGCGGELELQSGFFVLTCLHCRSVLRIIQPDTAPAYLIKSKLSKNEARFHLDQFLKQNHLPLTGFDMVIEALYYPYWKIDAIVLKLRHRIEEFLPSYEDSPEREDPFKEKKTEIMLAPFMTTFAAGPDDDRIPFSIGMRSEYIKLFPYSEENIENDFGSMPAIKPWADMQGNMRKNAANLGNMAMDNSGKNRTELFRPIGAIVFFPYYIFKSVLDSQEHCFTIDGVTGRVLNDIINRPFSKEGKGPGVPQLEFGKLKVEFHRCPNCGVELPPEQSYIYICHNCQQLIQLEKNLLFNGKIDVAVSAGGKSDLLLPFWTLKLPPDSTRQLQTMFGGIYNSDRLVIPGFKILNFEAMYRLAKKISSALPKINFSQ
ncbi:MAG: hypothetical protein NTV06_07555, partial [candidate division Zixibacteria bacterium]|nr:hypothetical protein [candidate division Zixibacteria bacterium]